MVKHQNPPKWPLIPNKPSDDKSTLCGTEIYVTWEDMQTVLWKK